MSLTPLGAAFLGIIIEGIFYGVYVVLFILYLVLRRRNNRVVDGPLTLAQILLFGLCTLSLCLDIPSGYYFVVVPNLENPGKNPVAGGRITLTSMVIFALIDYLAQMILLYRCWIVWGRRWVVVAVPGFLALVTLGGGLALAGLVNSAISLEDVARIFRPIGIATYSISLVANALTTSLIVTKIVLASREVYPGLGSNSRRPFRVVTAVLIESGVLMFAFQLVFSIFYQRLEFGVVSGATTQIYGITPTLLNIRVITGTTFDKTTEKIHSLRFAHSGGVATQIAGSRMGVAGVQSRGINTEFDDALSNKEATDNAV